MREDEFRKWLLSNGANSEDGRDTRVAAVKKIETVMSGLGSIQSNLDAAFAFDGFAQLRARLKAIRADAKSGGQDYRLLMPESQKPLNRLGNWSSWLAQYGRFLVWSDNTPEDERFLNGMAQMRETFLDRIEDFENMRAEYGQFWEIEKAYKYAARGSCVAISVDQGTSDGVCGEQIYRRLCQTTGQGNPLSWRTLAEVEKAPENLKSKFYECVGRLARIEEEDLNALENAARELEALCEEGISVLKRGEVLGIVITVYGTVWPNQACWFKARIFGRLGQLLLGKSLFPSQTFEIDEFEEFQNLLIRMRTFMDAEWQWEPETLEDVQGFVWVSLDEQWNSGEETEADRIRQFALEHYINPARERGDENVTLVAGPLNNEMGLNQAWPNICQALEGVKFQQLANVPPPETEGARQSTTRRFRFFLKDLEAQMTPREPTNLILYGPPGTGKTYATAAEAVRLCGEEVPSNRAALMARYNALIDAERIGFVTFHQNFSYEDFVEGLRPVPLESEEGNAVGFQLRAEPGVFRKMCENAGRASIRPGIDCLDRTRSVFKIALGRRGEEENRINDGLKNGLIHIGWGENVDWTDEKFDEFEAIRLHWMEHKNPNATGKDPNIEISYTFRATMEIGDYVVLSDGRDRFRAIGRIVSNYYYDDEAVYHAHRRKVEWLWQQDAGEEREKFYPKGFRRHASYRLATDLIDWDALDQIVFGQGTQLRPEFLQPHVLIIDEINRANISKVFGELITLIEPDKRGGMENALSLTLPYSKRAFSVPANLHIIGTMNTADRSIALLDTALRRRFLFREMVPEPALLAEAQAHTGLPLVGMLGVINDRIEYLLDREHRIGHAFFMGCTAWADVDAVMRDKVIPLLAEYFFEDWGRIHAVLGDGFIARERLKAPPGFDEGEKPRWQVRGVFADSAYAMLAGHSVPEPAPATDGE